jgi:hypothetical protein
MQELTVLVQTNERLEQQLNSQSQSPAASGSYKQQSNEGRPDRFCVGYQEKTFFDHKEF